MMSRSSSNKQMKSGLGNGSAEKSRKGRDQHVGGGPPMPTGWVMSGGDQRRHKNTMGDGSGSPQAKNIQQ